MMLFVFILDTVLFISIYICFTNFVFPKLDEKLIMNEGRQRTHVDTLKMTN